SDGVTHTVNLSWMIVDYDGNIAGDYTATGTFVLPEGVYQVDPDLRLEVTAIVMVKAKAVVKSIVETATVVFDGNGGTPATTEEEVEVGVTVETLPPVARDGYTFVVWNTAQDGTGEVFTIESAVTMDTTVYAIWEEAEEQHEAGTNMGKPDDSQTTINNVAGKEEA
ncbi:MAG: InlB B-repeat-containing protein, partial [Bacillota bacterium]